MKILLNKLYILIIEITLLFKLINSIPPEMEDRAKLIACITLSRARIAQDKVNNNFN
jgi:hypothetical protein